MAVAMEGVEEGSDRAVQNKKKEITKRQKKRLKTFVERDVKDDEAKAVQSDWAMKTVSGADLMSKVISVSQDNKHLIVASGDQVLVYAAASGHLVRKLNTGPLMTVMAGKEEGTVYTASLKEVCLWSYSTVEVVKRFPIFATEGKCEFSQGDVEDIYLPPTFGTNKIVFLTVKMGASFALYRVNLSSHLVNKIFKNIKVGSVHQGDNGNCVCAISSMKKGEAKDAAVLVYDHVPSKVLSVRTDQDRPFTVARLHPTERMLAAGDASGRVLVFSGLEQAEPAKAILHWHWMPVKALAWSEEGATLYSGGGEAALCKWRREEGGKPQVVPRLEAPVVHLVTQGELTILQLANNSLVVVDRQEDRVRGVVGGLAKSQTGFPAGLTATKDRLVLNGTEGKVQIFSPESGRGHSLDITGQNYLSRERGAVVHNSEVERIAVTEDGNQLATLDCQWSTLPRITLRFWIFDPAIDNYTLNTQVDMPHSGGVVSLSFQPNLSTSPFLLSVGRDCRAKLWGKSSTSSSSWTCVSSLQLRGLEASGGDWSEDGSVLGVAFEHLVTLWDTSSRLRSSLSVQGGNENVSKICFGKGASARLVFAASSSMLTAWDLVSLAPAWSIVLEPSININVLACSSSPLVALVQKEQVMLLNSRTGSVEHRQKEANCTGGAVWVQDSRVSSTSSSLHFLTYSGQLNRLSKLRKSSEIANSTPLLNNNTSSHLGSLLASAAAKQNTEVATQWTRAGREDEVEAVLSLPLHALPPPSQLAPTLVRARLLGLPRERVRGGSLQSSWSHAGYSAQDEKHLQRLEAAFPLDEPPQLSVKAFCKLFKSADITNQ